MIDVGLKSRDEELREKLCEKLDKRYVENRRVRVREVIEAE